MGAATVSGSSVRDATGRQPRRSILVVDENEGIRENLQDLLASEQALVLAAADAYEALSFLKMEEVNLLLTDYKVPGSNGIELIKAARRKNPNVAAVLMTAHFDVYEQLARNPPGGVKVLPKPFDADEVLRVVKEELGLTGETES